MAGPVITLDLLTFFFLLVYTGVVTFVAVAFPQVQRRWFMGTLGRAEYRNKNGIVGVIESPEGLVAIERLRLRFPGLLQSLAAPARMGRYFFAGEGAILKPVGSARLAFIDARSGVAAGSEVIATVEAVRGKYRSESEAVEARLEAAEAVRNRAAYQDLKARDPGAAAAAPAPRKGVFGKGKEKRAVVPLVKDYEGLAVTWAETRYYPSREYVRRVGPSDAAARVAMQARDPAGYAVWKQSYIEDQVNALLFQAEKDNDMSVMNEIKTGILRKTRVLETYEMAPDGLTVAPRWTTIQETKGLPKELRLRWFTGVTREFAKDPAAWPLDIGGRVVEVKALADFKLTMLGQGQVDDMLENERNINADEQAGRDTHLIKIAIAVLIVMVGAGAFVYLLLHA